MSPSPRARSPDEITALTTLGLVLLACRAFVDGAYSVPALSTLYFGGMLGVLSLAAFERGRLPGARAPAAYDGAHALFVLTLLAYVVFELLSLWRSNLWGLGDALKRLSPFLLLLVLPLAQARSLRLALLAYAFSVLVVNAASVPFDFAWTTWGSARTLTGIYFFKTDLAFGLVTALLLIVLLLPGHGWLIALCTLAVGAMIVLSNARLNYATFLLVVLYALSWRGMRLRTFLLALVATAAFAGAVLWIAETRSQLSIVDVSNIGRFTQGRARIWTLLLQEVIWYYDLRDVLVGRGYRYDMLLSLLHSPRAVYDSHNEVLSQLVNRGISGLLAYALIWCAAIRYLLSTASPGPWTWHRRYALLTIVGLLALQSVTSVVSEYSTKTWPFLFCIVAACIRFRADSPAIERASAPVRHPVRPATHPAVHPATHPVPQP